MVNVAREKSVSNYKLTIIFTKYFTILMALFDIVHTSCSYFNIDAFILTIFSGMSISTLILAYLLSYTFGYCRYHRIPLHYIVINNILAIYDYYIGIPISDKALYCSYLVIFGLFFIWYVADYKKSISRNYK